MSFVHVGLFLAVPGRRERAEQVVAALLTRVAAAPGFASGARIERRVGHGDRWTGWMTTWLDRSAMQAAADDVAPLTAELQSLAEPRACQEVMLETTAFDAEAPPAAGTAPRRRRARGAVS